MFFLLSSFIIALNGRFSDFHEETEALIRKIQSQTPQMPLFAVMSGDDALLELCFSLKRAKIALNTRMLSDDAEAGYPSQVGKKYEATTKASVRAGLTLKDVVSNKWLPYCQSLSRELSNASGDYRGYHIGSSFPSFLNFIVLEYPEGHKEVFFGWAISPGRGFEQPCFRTNEVRLVQFFKNWHEDLCAFGTPISGE